ncbi:hypoxanthine phosphoribosyltransferase [Dethiosulfatarculus sandiegensis]|uniref:hypoxanthine phosphoribosyltransferase n=1 Tax=Dethiosulfatarculus sandiegensis TaxID=1429043 RepID=UPI001E57400D|nr:hypoxanthine phosphoribosyltransferase [Dethiosulfatarculus sandiegensis]
MLKPEKIQDRIAELAKEISEELKDQKVVLLGVLKGAFLFLADLARKMEIPVSVDFVRVSSYGGNTESSGKITLTKACEIDVTDCTVIVIEDIVDTGFTLTWLVDHLKAQGCRQVKTCSLVDKPERRGIDLKIDYVGFNIPEGFLVGYGMDYDERYRQLPGIYELKLEG